MTAFPKQEQANCDDSSIQKNISFADSLKDLHNLRTQLYSAAEYFELSYTNANEKQVTVESLKDYAIKALVNTIDHLGSMSYNVNNLLNEKVEEVSMTTFKISTLEQRLSTCKEYIHQEVLAQQSSMINAPKHHKRYVLPVGETIKGANDLAKLRFHGSKLEDTDDWYHFKQSFGATIGEIGASSYSFRKGRPLSPSLRPSKLQETFSFSATTHKKDQDKRSVSPRRFPLLRSGSLTSRPSSTPKPIKPTTTPNAPLEIQKRNPSKAAFRSASMRVHNSSENDDKELQRHPSKSKRLLKSFLSRRKAKKDDDTIYTYLDEY